MSMDKTEPLVGVIMGSKSDWETMRHAAEVLAEFGVPCESRVVSAHRTPQWMCEYAATAEERGLQVIIAGAGGAAHLPGMVHNSGHLTIDAPATCQFEQQVRAVCGLPLGSTEQLRPAAMANLLGDLWSRGEPDWPAACALDDVKLHLYGKAVAKPGRKMGHLTALAADGQAAADRVLQARQMLSRNLQEVSVH